MYITIKGRRSKLPKNYQETMAIFEENKWTKELEGDFCGIASCKIEPTIKGIFHKKVSGVAIRIYDIMPYMELSKEGFVKVFNLLIEEYGEPKFYDSDYGYVWKTADGELTFGYCEIRYGWSVVSIYITKRKIDLGRIEYSNYKAVEDALIASGFCKENDHVLYYYGEFGFSAHAWEEDFAYDFKYKNGQLQLTCNKLVPLTEEEMKAQNIRLTVEMGRVPRKFVPMKKLTERCSLEQLSPKIQKFLEDCRE